MVEPEPATALGPFSSDGAAPTPWPQARVDLRDSPVYWLTTVRPDARPHVTPLLGIWLDGALYFCTGPAERKARNLAENPHCVLTTGSNQLDGLDIVVEGEAATMTDGSNSEPSPTR
jgi:general stress protein 26